MKNTKNALSATLLFKKRFVMDFILGFMICLTSVNLTIFAAPSTLDPSFGNGGIVLSNPDGGTRNLGYDMALLPDGKILMTGVSYSHLGFFVAKYNSDGTLDTTFGSNGWTVADFGGSFDANSYTIEVQPDGKIVVGGLVRPINSNQYDFGIVRFNGNGSLDTTFGVSGKVRVSFVPEIFSMTYRELLSHIKIDGSGKILVAGYIEPDFRFLFARLNADGSLDTTFGTNGKLVDYDIRAYPRGLEILPDGSFVLSGSGYFGGSGSSKIAVKYNPDGSRSWIYSDRGSSINGNEDEFFGMAKQTDGKFVFVGKQNDLVSAFRLNANGTVDNSFNGLSSFSLLGRGISVAIQPNGKIVANFSTHEAGILDNSFNLIRYNADGSFDSGFNPFGIIRASPTSGANYGRKVIVQPDGKILIGGYSIVDSSNTNYYFTMMRYMGDFTAPNNPKFDYDGDGKADVSVFRPSDGTWYLNQSTNGFSAARFGASTDKLVPADYDGDGKTDVAVYRDGNWFILQSTTNSFKAFTLGSAEEKPQTGDFDGDGVDDFAVFRPSNGLWRVLKSSNNTYLGIYFGASEDIPKSADYDGDGKTDVAVFRPSNGAWYIQQSTGGFKGITFGFGTDIPVPADYDGDGKADVAVFRPSNGAWYIQQSNNGFTGVNFGFGTDIPVPADYDGDGKTDIAVFRPSNGAWYQMLSTNGFSGQIFGFGTDRPTPGVYNP